MLQIRKQSVSKTPLATSMAGHILDTRIGQWLGRAIAPGQKAMRRQKSRSKKPTEWNMPRNSLILAGIFLLSFLLQANAQTGSRAAFLVGNAAYEFTDALDTPVQDVDLLAGVLEELGFEIHPYTNLTRREMASELAYFLSETRDADVLLFYFGGHGLQFEGRNYLVGIDGQLETEFDIEAESLALDRVVEQFERASRTALVLVDASRENPLADKFYEQSHPATRPDLTRGLAPVDSVPAGTVLSFSASPGQVVSDGAENAWFVQALARHLPTPDIDILSVLNRVAIEVQASTDGRQVPTAQASLLQKVYLELGSGDDGAAIAYDQQEAMYQAALQMDSLRAWRLYIERFPEGFFGEMAAMALDRLQSRALLEDLGIEIGDVDELDRSSIPNAVAQGIERTLGVSTDDVRAAQADLARLGYNVGPVDGVIGPRTRGAIAAFQSDTGLPPNGILTAATATALGVDLALSSSPAVPPHSARIAQRYDADQLGLVESDARLLDAVQALSGYDLTYGFFNDHVYVAVNLWTQLGWDDAVKFAERAGGHLVTLASADENTFVFDLVRHDENFWTFWEDPGSGPGATGPTLGFVQEEGSREPDGGWTWVTGEDLEFENWRKGQPNNHNGMDFVATYLVMAEGRADRRMIAWEPTWADQRVLSTTLIIEIE
jgi:hypothetical protein